MPQLGQSSFRRILLTQILLLSLPVLLVGEYVTYRKARSGLLETARYNLTESASRKSSHIQDWIESLESSLIIATQSSALQSGQVNQYTQFLKQLEPQFPSPVDCLQLTDLKTEKLVASTCGQTPIYSIPKDFWQPNEKNSGLDLSRRVHISNYELYTKNESLAQGQPDSVPVNSNNLPLKTWRNQISLVFSAPVYVSQGIPQGQQKLPRYALSLESNLVLTGKDKPKSLTGFTVIIDQSGVIIAHPNYEKLGKNIEEEGDAKRLRSLLNNALDDQENSFIHLFLFDQKGQELLAGYDAIISPISADQNSQWVVLAVASLEDALSGLNEIKSLLFYLIFCLVVASIVAALYLSRDLARPLEKLRDYALTVNSLESPSQVPQNLKIREFNQLAAALNTMVGRLRARAEALEFASKEAQAANRTKNEFLRVVSHELITPLNGIINPLLFVLDDYCDNREEEKQYLSIAKNLILHLTNLVKDIFDIALIEEGKLSVMLEPTNLTEILTEAINLQAFEIQQKDLTLTLPSLDKPIIVNADPDKLRQVFLNILSNAVKFTKEGGITILTRIEFAPAPELDKCCRGSKKDSSEEYSVDYQVVVTIKDTGIGVDLKDQEKLFQPFAMVDATTTREFGGIGLGLAISRSLMQMMEGTISLYSKGLGEGTSVIITIPLMPASSEDNPHHHHSKDNGKRQTEEFRVKAENKDFNTQPSTVNSQPSTVND